ncbi:MAG: hypothetical protein KGL11_00470 [Alphaproteobacteria bacterium]|nr:hypothetical protein [Alphaproteobacteria bacterium]
MRRLLLVLALIAAPLAAHADGFVPGTEDLPLMPGLAPVANSAVVFDKPEGRIVEASARGRLTRYDVTRFYAQTLPQLGWRHVAGTAAAWTRTGERLHLDFRGPDGDLTVGFTIAPQ